MYSKADAQRARKQGENVLATSRQKAGEIERGANNGNGLLKHKGHDLRSGGKGEPHYQTDGKYGHTFWGSAAGILGGLVEDMLDPFGAISGELGNGELPDYYWQNEMDPCKK